MPYIKAWFHLVWATKNRQPLLKKEIRRTVFDHIKSNGRSKGIHVDCVEGYIEHVHCIVSLSSDQTISKTVQLLKGESSRWINNEKLCKEKFEWQDEYFAISFSHPDLAKVMAYIYNQENHHQKMTFQQEYEALISKYDFVEKSGGSK